MIKPQVFGYVVLQSARSGAGSVATGSDRVALCRFASREGFDIRQVFVDTDAITRTAFESMIEAIRHHEVAAVLLPDPTHLGQDDRGRDDARHRIQATGTAVISIRLRPAQPMDGPGLPAPLPLHPGAVDR